MDPTTTVPIEAMLSQDGFVRGLARRLVFDGGETQDLVQDAWVAALRRPPREERAARAWFATTLRRLARDRVGTDRARRERERQVSRPEAVPSVVDILEREAARREVVEALLNLPETYRDVLLLRFWDDLSPQRIAKRLGRPAATVRSQLHRGLALLRERLDERSGGDRRAWALGLVPLLRLRWGLGLAGAWPLAGAIMTGKYWITAALVAALMLGGGGWALGLFEATAPGTVGGGAGPEQPEQPTPEQAAGVGAEAGGDHRVAVGPSEAASTGYHLVDATGRPAADLAYGIGGGFFVTKGQFGHPDEDVDLGDRARRTDADGRVALEEGERERGYLWVRSADGWQEAFDLRGLAPGTELRLQPTASFEVACLGVAADDRWKLWVEPALEDEPGDWGLGFITVPLAGAEGQASYLHLRIQILDFAGPGPVEVPVPAGQRFQLSVRGEAFRMTEPEDRPLAAPGRWTFSLEERSPSVRVVVVEPGDDRPAEVDGRVWVQRGQEGQDFVLADGVARIGYMRLVAGEELKLLVTLDDGEWWQERLEPDASGATLRLARGQGHRATSLVLPEVWQPGEPSDLLAERFFVVDDRDRVHNDSMPGYWSATGGGIARIDDGRWRRFLLPQGFALREVVLCDGSGHWWVARPGGVPHRLEVSAVPTVALEAVDLGALRRTHGDGVRVTIEVRLGDGEGARWIPLTNDRVAGEAPAPGRTWPVRRLRVPVGAEARLGLFANYRKVTLPLATLPGSERR